MKIERIPYAAMLLPRAETIISMADHRDPRAGRIYKGLAMGLVCVVIYQLWRHL